MKSPVPQVGAPDPELKTSPIFDEYDEEAPAEFDIETGVCYFNGEAYGMGEYVLSGSEPLRRERRGVWVREGETRPD
ncbi:MAG: hypothetical protein WBM28_08770 [Burkholderiales bacterium]